MAFSDNLEKGLKNNCYFASASENKEKDKEIVE